MAIGELTITQQITLLPFTVDPHLQRERFHLIAHLLSPQASQLRIQTAMILILQKHLDCQISAGEQIRLPFQVQEVLKQLR